MEKIQTELCSHSVWSWPRWQSIFYYCLHWVGGELFKDLYWWIYEKSGLFAPRTHCCPNLNLESIGRCPRKGLDPQILFQDLKKDFHLKLTFFAERPPPTASRLSGSSDGCRGPHLIFFVILFLNDRRGLSNFRGFRASGRPQEDIPRLPSRPWWWLPFWSMLPFDG